MKKIIILIITLNFTLYIYSQNYIIDSISKYHTLDKKTIEKLENFLNKGIEYNIETQNITALQIIDTAKSFLGTPHCMGGITHSCIDCSGLLYVSFKKNNINIPHNSEDIARYGKIIFSTDSLLPGDLVFFINTYQTRRFITHSGIYLGKGEFIHTSYKKGVIISNLKENYYKEHYIFGTRIFHNKGLPSKK